ncbi:MAG: tetratricopeptide repeat protein [Acidobacteria bacterium]|nr:tetratricopeptide repeat protein [Acidobacteriota bacterium]MCA1652330.1 tetratricopeptide repeat protein [Acidobacteriota bacterium]
MIALQQGNAASAVSITEGQAAFEDVEGPGLTAMYMRGRAHLAAGSPAGATEAFQKCATTPAGDTASPVRAYCLIGLARARSAAGDADGSRKAYEEFLTLWKDADPDVPILTAAKSEYAKAKR